MKASIAILFLVCLGAALAQSEVEFNKEVEIYRNSQDKFCWKSTYGRGVGLIPKDCGSDKEYDAGLCYKRCNSGYNGVGPVCWDFPRSYGRGVGTIPKSCQDSKQYDAGLCYPFCRDSFYGVGPVCWKSCIGSTPVNCGAACGSSAGACGKAIFNMVKSVLNMIKDLAKLILTGATFADQMRALSARSEPLGTFGACVLRLAVLPLIMLALARWLPCPIELRRVIVIQAAMPCAVIPVLLSKHYGGDPAASLRIILWTSAIGLLTIPFWLQLGFRWIGAD